MLARRYAPGILFLLIFFAASASDQAVAQVQAPERLTLEDIHLRGTYSGAFFRGGRWADEGPVVLYVDTDGQSGATHLVSYNLETDERTRLIDGNQLYADDVGRLIRIHDYAYSSGGDRVLIYTDSERVWRYPTQGFYYVYDLRSNELTPVADRDAGFQMFAKFAPDGNRVAFVRDRNLYVVDLESGDERALTTDGSDGAVINGTTDWVYEEEFGLRDGWHWSPDGRFIAFVQLDETDTREFAMTDLRGDYPEFTRFRYPKAGEVNSEIRVGVVDMTTHDLRFFDTGTWRAGGDSLEYIPQLGWTPEGVGEGEGGANVWLFRMNRDQNVLDLMYGNPETMEADVVLRETSDTWLDIETGFNDLTGGTLTHLDDGSFVWLSARDGYRHLYLYDADGNLQRRLTDGDWDVTAFHGIDFANDFIYFTSTRESSMERHLYRAGFSRSGDAERVTAEAGWHSINMSRDLNYFIDSFSTADAPTTTLLKRASGDLVTTLEDNQALRNRLAPLRLRDTEFLSVAAADGTPLNASLIKPINFDESREYPVLMYVYGGPGSQTVVNRWGGGRYLWHQYLANELDIIVASVDNRGTGGRGNDFMTSTYRRLGQLEALDQIAAARELGGLPYVDASRIGIWGWSYGGYLTLMAMLYEDGPATFKMGLSVAPVTDWRLYDTIYTERFMSTPQRNAVGYREGAPLTFADRLSDNQRLLLVHGDLDDNVHYQNVVQMADAFQSANKQFDMMIYPGRDHGIGGGITRLHLHTLLTNYVSDHLVGR